MLHPKAGSAVAAHKVMGTTDNMKIIGMFTLSNKMTKIQVQCRFGRISRLLSLAVDGSLAELAPVARTRVHNTT
jgi:hypothetical protein